MENNEQNNIENQPQVNTTNESVVPAETVENNTSNEVTENTATTETPINIPTTQESVTIPESTTQEPVVKEEKKSKSNNPILIVIILILLCAIGYLVYDNYIKKDNTPNTNNQITQQEENNKNGNQNNNEELKCPDITKCNDERFIYENLSTECTDEEIKIAVQKYEDLLSKTADEPSTFLGYIGYENAKEKIDPTTTKYKNIDYASTTSINFDDFKSKMLNYISESYLENEWLDKYVANDNGNLVILFTGHTGSKATVTEVFKFKNENTNKYYAIETITSTELETKTIKEYSITKINGKCVIGN